MDMRMAELLARQTIRANQGSQLSPRSRKPRLNSLPLRRTPAAKTK